MFILYAVLVLSTIAVVGVAFAIYRLVRRHMRQSHQEMPAKPGPVGVRPSPQLVRSAGTRK